MHYYQFNIGDYASHTAHLDELEDLAYRRMLDYCYLNEIGLPESPQEIARLIRMRTQCERIANVLHEFFELHGDGFWRQARIEREIDAFRAKSDKSRMAARKRWDKNDADAMRTHSERNAIYNTLTNNHNTLTKSKSKRFTKPTLAEVSDYIETRTIKIDPQRFINHYESNGWKVGKNPMKDWKAAVRTWEGNQHGKNNGSTFADPNERGISGAERTRRAREQARLRELAR